MPAANRSWHSIQNLGRWHVKCFRIAHSELNKTVEVVRMLPRDHQHVRADHHAVTSGCTDRTMPRSRAADRTQR
jgi:hypothetical protein